MEEFRKIEGFDNYEVSNLGNVRNITSGKVLKSSYNNGYKRLNVSCNGEIKGFLIHRLIAIAFIPNPDNKPYIDHIDGNTLNNSIDNLRWATCQENQYNRKLNPDSKSGFKGVLFDEKTNYYQSIITFKGKTRTIGYYKTEEDAIIARYYKAMEIQKEFINQDEVEQFNQAKKRKQERNEEVKDFEEFKKDWLLMIERLKGIKKHWENIF